MNRNEYKNKFYKEHYERINLAVPKGMKEIIKRLASEKGMSVNSYLQYLVSQDQCKNVRHDADRREEQRSHFRNYRKYARRL